MTPDKVAIVVPAMPEYVQTVRLVTAGLASRLKFTIDEIEDLKIGVDELCAYVTGPHGRDGSVRIEFEVGADYVSVRGRGDFPSGDGGRTSLTQLSRQIVETVADEARFEVLDGRPQFSLVKRKSSDTTSAEAPA